MSTEKNTAPDVTVPELLRTMIGQLDSINLRLGWVLASCRIMDLGQLNKIRELMDSHASNMSGLMKSMEASDMSTYNLCLLSLPQSNITHSIGGFDSEDDEIRYVQQMDLRMREAFETVEALLPYAALLAGASALEETKKFLCVHIRAMKHYIQAL